MGHFTEAVGYPVITCITGYTLLALAAVLVNFMHSDRKLTEVVTPYFAC